MKAKLIFGMCAALPLWLAACSADIRELPLDETDLNDRETVARLNAALSPDEKSLLALYRLVHWPGSSSFCGEVLVDAEGHQPETIGQAIAMTKAREERRRLLLAEQERPLSPREKLDEERLLLVARADQLMSERSLLFERFGPDMNKRREFKENAEAMAATQRDIARIDAKLRDATG